MTVQIIFKTEAGETVRVVYENVTQIGLDHFDKSLNYRNFTTIHHTEAGEDMTATFPTDSIESLIVV